MIKKTLFAFIFFVSCGSIHVLSQISHIINIPSPEVAGLGQYGVVPVSLFTGVPDISIPLYEIKVRGYSFPISANYHLASVKPGTQPGCLGMGWSLFADGYISRSVHGEYDEKCDKDGTVHGFYDHASKLKNITPKRFAEETQHISSDSRDKTPYYELAADEFSFSFCGYSGKFYRSEEGGWHVISDDDIRVEFDPLTGFINLNELSQRIPTTGWGLTSYNNRFFSRFTLITPDGCRYEFGGLHATEFSVPYYARYTSDLIPTTWRLVKITTVDKRVIEFTYDSSSIMCDLKYAPQSRVVYDLPCNASNKPQVGRNGMTGFLIFPVNLKTITTPNETIEFNYFREDEYSNHFVDQYLSWDTDNMYNRTTILGDPMEDPANQFHIFLRGIDFNSEREMRESIKGNLRHDILHSMHIKSYNSNTSRTIYFDYTFNNRRKLALITEREGSHELDGYDIPPAGASETPKEYRFAYNDSQRMPYDFVTPGTDSWGYYNGGKIDNTVYPSFQRKSPVLFSTLAEVLTEITYPTGGKNHFEYELNDYSKSINLDHQLTSSYGIAGGLRISKITTLDREGSTLQVKKYTYSETRNGTRSSGISKELPSNVIVYSVPFDWDNGSFPYFDPDEDDDDPAELELKSEGGFFPQVTNLNSPDVGYSCVIEENFNGEGESQGYVRYRFSNYDADIYGETHYDEPAVYSMLLGGSDMVPFTSRSMERGKLLSKETFDKNDIPREKTTYKYTKVNPSYFLTAHQEVIVFCAESTDAKVGTLAKTYTYSYLTDSIVETMYGDDRNISFKKETSRSYNASKLLQRETQKMGDEKTHSVEYTYPADYPQYNWMVEQQILLPVVSKRISKGNSYQKEEFEYSNVRGIPYQSKMTSHPTPSYSRTEYTVIRADSYANPVEIEEKGKRIVCIWGGEGQKLMARIENASYEQVMNKLQKSPESFSNLRIWDPGYRAIEDIRHQLSAAHFYIYKYTPELWLESVTEPNGRTIHYTYDQLGRLIETYYMEKVNDRPEKRRINLIDYKYYTRTPSDIGYTDIVVEEGESGL